MSCYEAQVVLSNPPTPVLSPQPLKPSNPQTLKPSNPQTPKHTPQSHPTQVAFLDALEPLPYMHTVHRAKIVWTVFFRGVRGEANLVRGIVVVKLGWLADWGGWLGVGRISGCID